MPANRIFTQPGQPIVINPAEPTSANTGVPAVVVILVPDPAQLAAWQEIYRLATERARMALEPPRHHQLLAVWN